MDLLQTKGKKIINGKGQEIVLRGTSIGAWMNMENFMNGIPGTEYLLRSQAIDALGQEKGEYIFNSMIDNFFTEKDVEFIASLQFNVIRIPLNYRHFEDEESLYTYKEEGFERFDKALSWCEKHGIYVIIDMHAAPGYQSTDWHSDNSSRRSLFWDTKDFQNRFIALWEEFARRYKGRGVVAGYNLLNEPMTNAKYGRLPFAYKPDWNAMNSLYKRTVDAIRTIDPDHIIFLEGDFFSMLFDGLDAPFADNLVYSSHNYSEALNDPHYGTDKATWTKEKVRAEFLGKEGTKFCDKYNVPLWVGEFGSHSKNNECPQIISDQIDVFEEFGAHWTAWSYKDTGVMGLVRIKEDCPYIELTQDVITYIYPSGKYPKKPMRVELEKRIAELADFVADNLPYDLRSSFDSNTWVLTTTIDDIYFASLLQPAFIEKFRDLSLEQIAEVMKSFHFDNCMIHATGKQLQDIIAKNLVH
jgi:endoglucanase